MCPATCLRHACSADNTVLGRKLFVLSSSSGLEAYGASAGGPASVQQQFIGRWAPAAAARGPPTLAAEGSRRLREARG
jgi:hypothetical protein